MKQLEERLELIAEITEPGHREVLTIMHASRALSGAASRLLREHDLTEAQFNVLMLLKHQSQDGMTQVGLSDRMFVNRANMTGLIDRMERDGLVRRRPRPGDRRVHVVGLTAGGQRRVDAAEVDYFKEISRITRRLSARDAAALTRSLLGMCDAIADGNRGT
ncbi:MAG: MarR family transcriptional regulator [Verrucomicrobia bacterium]|nr:MarR family transcriptional regulator [Verrucomicrobiota bacterium]MDA1087721.1 MarR family transcriptional regulator [Verrucomicrobiota bacterium]